jgi:hypothetical protein
VSLDRREVVSNLQQHVKNLLVNTEGKTGLRVQFESLPGTSEVVAQYRFAPPSKATISLGSDWQDVDVAHELTHMHLELIEGLFVLAWRRGVDQADAIERAYGRIRAYVDDEVVHARLVKSGYQVDGEVIKPQLFRLYATAASKLKKGRARFDDGMAHLDDIGYGSLCRSAFLVQARLILESYGERLQDFHLKRLQRFIDAFQTHLGAETDKADAISELFENHDVQSFEEHRQILSKWARIESLDGFVGTTRYRQCQSGFYLPLPEN